MEVKIETGGFFPELKVDGVKTSEKWEEANKERKLFNPNPKILVPRLDEAVSMGASFLVFL